MLPRRLPLLGLLLFLAPSARAQVVEYYHLDAVGNVRAITNASGTVIERHDYLPFGEECTTGPCAPIQGTNTRKFTGKERDAETGLDYFGARYYIARVGRFTTVDPALNVKASLVSPQAWNRYSYVRNNPVNRADPDGRMDPTLRKDYQMYRAHNGLGGPLTPAQERADLFFSLPLLAVGGLAGLGVAAEIGPALGPALLIEAQIAARSPEVQTAVTETVESFNGAPPRVSVASLELTHGRTMSRRAFERLTADIRENGVQEAIKYVEHNGTKFVVDGNHRVMAARGLGLKEVPAEQVSLPFRGFKTPDDLAQGRGW